MDITIPVSIQTPSRPGLFGPIGGGSTEAAVVLHIDTNIQSELASILGGAPATPLTPTGLAAQYSASDLSAALSIKLAGK